MRVLWHIKSGKSWLVEPGADFTTQFGKLLKADLEAKPGSRIRSSTGEEFAIFEAGWLDILKAAKRLPQAMMQKDLGLIIAITGINSESTVVDAGTGSGFLAAALARICKKVITYEIRKDCIAIAKANFELLGIKNIELREEDVCKGINEKDIDLVTLDLKEPWLGLDAAFKALKPGGWLVCFCPQATQALQLVNSLQPKFGHVLTAELIQRNWKLQGRIARPESMPAVHTGFIVFARRLA